MSRPEERLDAERLAALPPLPRDEDGPVFAEPWQAQAFALAVTALERAVTLDDTAIGKRLGEEAARPHRIRFKALKP